MFYSLYLSKPLENDKCQAYQRTSSYMLVTVLQITETRGQTNRTPMKCAKYSTENTIFFPF